MPEPEIEEFKECTVYSVLGDKIEAVRGELEIIKRTVEELTTRLGLKGFTYPREFSSFISDPIGHLKKKLFNYTYDLIRGRLGLEEYKRKAVSALNTSLRTNMRTAYQIWGIASLMSILADEGFTLVYPEHGFLNFDRSGKQKLGIIPPNAVLFSFEYGFISIFHEAPRPISWEDTSDLQRIWGLYTALRPDVMIYGGAVFNIVKLDENPPIMKPDLILEFKELEDWYTRVRDLKGYFQKPLTAEEWRSKWLEGLFEGLADIMGISKHEAYKRVEEGRSLRIPEYQLVRLYKSTYMPKKLVLISKGRIPSHIKAELEEAGITVLDNVGYDASKLKPLVDEVKSVCKFTGSNVKITLRPETAYLLSKAIEVTGLKDPDKIIQEALRRFLQNIHVSK